MNFRNILLRPSNEILNVNERSWCRYLCLFWPIGTKQTQVNTNSNKICPKKPTSHVQTEVSRLPGKVSRTTTSQNASWGPHLGGFHFYVAALGVWGQRIHEEDQWDSPAPAAERSGVSCGGNVTILNVTREAKYKQARYYIKHTWGVLRYFTGVRCPLRY